MAEDKQTSSTTTPHRRAKTVQESSADITLRLIEDHGADFGTLTPERETKLTRKLYLNIMGLVSMINLMLFVSLHVRATACADDVLTR